MNGTILHLMPDNQFSDMAVREFSRIAPEANQFVSMASSSSADVAGELKSGRYRALVLHSLRDEHAALLDDIPDSVRVAWIGWGFDYYDRLLGRMHPGGLLLPETARLVQSVSPRRWTRLLSIRRLVRRISAARIAARHLRRIDYFSPVLDVEHAMAQQWNPRFTAQYLSWNYGTAEDDLGLGAPVGAPGDNVLVGNSAASTNNHVEVFRWLAESGRMPAGKVIVPLGYGDDSYRKCVLEAGHRYLGAKFEPILDFMPSERYLEVLRSCNVVLMNHLRQQGLGTILTALAFGAAVFLNGATPLLPWLQARGFRVGELDNQSPGLSPEDQDENRALVLAQWGRDASGRKTRLFVEQLLS